MRMYLFRRAVVLLFVLLAGSAQAEVNRFLDAGIPAASRPWSGADYERTFKVLSSGSVPLPQWADRPGRAVLMRMTSPDNFSLHRNRSLPFQVRMEDYLKLQQNANAVGKLYLAPAAKNNGSTKEVAQFLAFSLYLSEVGVELMDEFLPTIPKDDRYAARMNGVKQFYEGLTTVFVGAELALAKDKGLAGDDRSEILRAMAQTLPRVKKTFSPEYRVELARKLAKDKSEFADPKDLQRMDAMLSDLKA
jgi:hypothetical protein